MFETRRKTNLSEQAYNQIKDAICQGRIAPGDILSESRLAEDLGMSRTPCGRPCVPWPPRGF